MDLTALSIPSYSSSSSFRLGPLATILRSLRAALYCVSSLLVFCTAEFSVSAQTLTVGATNFDTVQCGSKSCHKISFKNTTGTTQTLESLGVQGSTFSLEDINYSPPYIIPNGDSVQLLFCFNAGMPTGPYIDSISVQLKGVVNPQRVALRGHSVAPKMVVSQTTIDFGVIIIGTAKQITVLVSNQGDGVLTVPNASGVAPPFYVLKGAGTVIQPGATDTLSFLYVPATDQTDIATAVFGNPPCLTNLNIQLKGVAVKAPIPTIGGVLQVNPRVVDFDTAMCGETKSLNVQFLNVGSDTARIRSVVTPPTAPFSGTIPIVAIGPLKDTTFTIRYSPTVVPSRDSQTVRILADTRQSLSVGLLFDVSGSMTTAISAQDATIRLRAAKDAGKIFLSQLINDSQRNVVDQAQVMSFSSPADSFVVRSAFTINRGLSAFAIDGLVAKGGTCLYESLIRCVDSLKNKAHPVLILLSDGAEGSCDLSPPLASALSAISTNNIRVYVVGITDAGSPLAPVLQQIAAAGKGTATFAATQEEITNAFLTIARQLSQNIEVVIPLVGSSVAPRLDISPLAVQFDSVRVGERRCLPLTVRNIGTAAVTLNPSLFTNKNPQFEVRNLPVAALQPGGPAQTFEFCFSPTLLRSQAESVSLAYSQCQAGYVFSLLGTGYDSLIVEIDTSIVGARIGDTVHVPMRLLNTVPKSYAVDSMRINLGYNASVLALSSAPGPLTLSSQFPVGTRTTSYADLDATTTLRYSGGSLQNSVADSRLALFDFVVLRGNSMQSNIEVRSMTFADGNPKVGIVQPARVQLDPACWLAKRLLDPRERASQTQFLRLRPGGSRGSIRITYRVSEAARVRIIAYDALGRALGELNEDCGNAGEHECVLDCRSEMLSPLYLRIMANNESDSAMFQQP